MRLGANYSAHTIDDLEPLCEKMDARGLSAIFAPPGYHEWDDDACAAFGEKARSLGMAIGEAGAYMHNLMDPDADAVSARIALIRQMLVKADVMGARTVVTLVGSRDVANNVLSPDPYNFSDECKANYREICLRIVDGLDLKTTRYVTEPWFNCFYRAPEEIRAFLDSVDDPRVGLHLDQMNMVGWEDYFNTTGLIERTFDLLRDDIGSAHAKDIKWIPNHLGVRWDEVYVGDGVMDYDIFLKQLDTLDPDMTVYTEHFMSDEQFAIAVQRLHEAADAAGVRFRRRGD